MDTRVGKVFFSLDGSHYRTTIGERTLILITTTTQAGYGIRHWYLCPHCQRRSATLFIGKHDVACRTCWGLEYAIQSKDRLSRMRSSMIKQSAAIWPNYGPAQSLFNNPNLFPKPKGMRWETFSRKLARLMLYELAYWRAFSPVVERITGVIERKVRAAGHSDILTG
ncbi:hypothetical protein [Buttiauxella noackiae]|uniref:hypothetical protein n=1 Tax=Buttiauxella noackiae TaxID=82992 RepID=UPI0028D6E44A|nr:hypothetical protein [Buttiauxella noackiae]